MTGVIRRERQEKTESRALSRPLVNGPAGISTNPALWGRPIKRAPIGVSFMLMATMLVMRVDTQPGYVGIPFDNR